MKYGIDLPNMGECADPRLLAEVAHEAEKAAGTVASYAEAGATWWIEGVWSWLFLPPQDIERMRRRIRQGPPRVD